jgi:addiction module HigA family antidote
VESGALSLGNLRPRGIRPTHPGEMLREDFMAEYGLTVVSLAEALGTSRQTINELLRERREITPVMALKLSRLFGNTAEFWLNAQRALDLWKAETYQQKALERISRLHAA